MDIFKKSIFLNICIVLFLLLLTGNINTAAAASRGITLEAVEKTASTPFVSGTYRALIIGNNEYNDVEGRWSSLKTAVSDARALEKLLKGSYGFTDVRLLENSTRKDVILALQDLAGDVLSNDNVLVYYAGHGFLDQETNKGYWVPVDARGADKTTFLRNSTIRDELITIAARTKHTLLISDSCFSGTLLRSGNRGINTAGNSAQYYKKVANKKSVQIIAAGGVEYVDDDYKASGHSPFTYFLLNELKNNDQPFLTVSELSTNVEKAVANNVDQVPESGVLQGAGDELGEFIFIRVNVEVEGAPKEKVKVIVNVVEKEPRTTISSKNDFSLDLGLRLSSTGWEGTNNSDADIESTNGRESGLNITFQKERFYTGISILSGKYSFDNKTPRQITKAGSQNFSDLKIVHSEVDIVAGYFFWEHVSLFLDIKMISNKWENNDYTMGLGGLGFGTSVIWPLARKWDLFGHFAVIPSSDVEVDGNKIGTGRSTDLEFGATYNLNSNNRFGIGLNLKSQIYDFDSGDEQEHNFNSLFLSYNRTFQFGKQ